MFLCQRSELNKVLLKPWQRVGVEVFSYSDVVLAHKLHPSISNAFSLSCTPSSLPALGQGPDFQYSPEPHFLTLPQRGAVNQPPLRKAANLLGLPDLWECDTHSYYTQVCEGPCWGGGGTSPSQKLGLGVPSQVSSHHWRAPCFLKVWNGKILWTTTFLYHIKLLI